MTEPRATGVRPWRLDRRTASGSIPRAAHRRQLDARLDARRHAVAVPIAGAIALVEDVGETPVRARSLPHAARARRRAARGARGVIVGDLTRCVDPEPPSGEPIRRRGARRSCSSARARRACRARSERRSAMAIATTRCRSAATRSSISTRARSRSSTPRSRSASARGPVKRRLFVRPEARRGRIALRIARGSSGAR